ncbi:MAG: AgmX/PglI C-terminal domain-containing protein [Archangium sp.]|nr:AgmX/PglI C-terminal domain-containing protein [Archangium sp.]
MSLLAATVILLTGSSLDRTAIKAVLQGGSPGFKRCYEAALRRDPPDLEGRARLTLTVAPSGQVSEVSVDFPMIAPGFTQCLRGVALRLRFLEGPAGFKLTWPIVFRQR